MASAAAMNSRNTRGPAYGRNRGRGLLAPHRAGCPGPAVLLPVPGGLFHSEPDVRIKGPGRLLPASDDKYCPVPPGGPGAQGRGQTWARLLEGDIHPATGSRPGEAAAIPAPGPNTVLRIRRRTTGRSRWGKASGQSW